MRIVSIDAATRYSGLAVMEDEVLRGEWLVSSGLTHSQRLMPALDFLLQETDLTIQEIDALVVSQGPGSFTGLRIGMAAAKGIAMAAGVPLIGVPTLDGLAAQVPALDLPVCCLLDARKQQVYAAFYRYNDDFSCLRIGEPLVLSPEALVQRIQAPTLVAGPGIVACSAQLAAHRQARVLPAGTIHPRAALIGFCGAQILANGAAGTGADLVPWYVRASEAELNLR